MMRANLFWKKSMLNWNINTKTKQVEFNKTIIISISLSKSYVDEIKCGRVEQNIISKERLIELLKAMGVIRLI